MAVAIAAVAVAAWPWWWERDPVKIRFAYSTDAGDLLGPLIERFNEEQDDVLVVGTVEPSGEVLEDLLAGRELEAWMPASSTWGQLLNHHEGAEIAPMPGEGFFYSPQVIGTFEGVQDDARISDWSDIVELSTGERDLPEGVFRFGHTNPLISTSGLHALASEFLAISGGEPRIDPVTIEAVRRVERSVLHYGDIAKDLCPVLARYGGGSYVSAFYMQETTFLECRSEQEQLVPILPHENFVADYPVFVLRGIPADERSAAEDFVSWLKQEVDAQLVIDQNFRFGKPWDGVGRDPAPVGAIIDQAWVPIDVPPGDLLSSLQEAWPRVRKPSQVLIIVDGSGLHGEDTLGRIKDLLKERLVAGLPDHTHVRLDLAAEDARTLVPMQELSANARKAIVKEIEGLIGSPGVDSDLIGAIDDAVTDVDEEEIITVVVVVSAARLSDSSALERIESRLGRIAGMERSPVQVYTVSFGNGTSDSVLDRIAFASLGACADAQPESEPDVDRCEKIAPSKLLENVARSVG